MKNNNLFLDIKKHRLNLIYMQGCQLSQIIRATPDFEPYLPVSRLMSGISRIIAEVCYFL